MLDLRGCSTALLLDRADSKVAHKRQMYLDNRKHADELLAESSTATALLLLLRGVRGVALHTHTSVPSINMQLLTALLDALGQVRGFLALVSGASNSWMQLGWTERWLTGKAAIDTPRGASRHSRHKQCCLELLLLVVASQQVWGRVATCCYMNRFASFINHTTPTTCCLIKQLTIKFTGLTHSSMLNSRVASFH